MDIANMTLEQLQNINQKICVQIEYLRNKENAKASINFNIGDIISFYTKKYGTVKIKIEKVGLKIKGKDMNKLIDWSVEARLCQKWEE